MRCAAMSMPRWSTSAADGQGRDAAVQEVDEHAKQLRENVIEGQRASPEVEKAARAVAPVLENYAATAKRIVSLARW
jgi:hypothetical protein